MQKYKLVHSCPEIKEKTVTQKSLIQRKFTSIKNRKSPVYNLEIDSEFNVVALLRAGNGGETCFGFVESGDILFCIRYETGQDVECWKQLVSDWNGQSIMSRIEQYERIES